MIIRVFQHVLLTDTHEIPYLFCVRSPLLTKSRLISLPMGTEMFHFPTFVAKWIESLDCCRNSILQFLA